MKKRLVTTALLLLFMFVWIGRPAQAQEGVELPDVQTQRLAQTGMKFLSLSISPRAAAMGDAVSADAMGAASMFYNPAGMARLNNFANVQLGQVQWISDIQYNAGAVAVSPMNGRYGIVGVSVRSVDYGDFLETIRWDNTKGYRDVGTYSPAATAVGLGYAKALTNRFSVGANLKWVRQSLGKHAMDVNDGDDPVREAQTMAVGAVDFGVIYKTGYRDLTFAANIRNFGKEHAYHEQEFELPLTFQIGLSMNVAQLVALNPESQSIRLSVDARRPRDYSEQVSVGAEYAFQDFLFLRAGYVYPHDERGLNMGLGLHLTQGGLNIGADYAYTQFGHFGHVNRIGLNFGF